jgi:phosphate transport system substrate-binding protein
MALAGATTAGAAEGAVSTAAVDANVQISGAGATFPLNIIEQWKADFKKDSGATVNYAGVGSGGGKTQFIAGTVDFAGTDTLASATEKPQLDSKYGSWLYIPETAGGIALGYKVAGLSSLKLSAATLAKIFAGTITKWNDPAITTDNGTAGPNKDIQVYVRSDSSGTSGVFTQYLTAAAPNDWKAGSTQQFPTNNGQIGKAGSDGVANAVAAADGSIGYFEVSFAKERSIDTVSVKNAAGQFVGPTSAAVREAIDDATVNPDGSLALAFTGPNPAAYPVSTVSYFLAPTKMDDKKGDNLKAFLTYVLSDAGQARAEPLSYAPLPSKVLSNSRVQITKINPSAATVTTTPSAGIQTGLAGAPSTPRPAATTATTAKPKAVTTAAAATGAAAGAGSSGGAALARTGSASGMLAGLAGSLVLAGLLLLAVGRRKDLLAD